MTLVGDDSYCSSPSLWGSSGRAYGEGEDAYYLEKPREPDITPVYNGRTLKINSELTCHALSGISVKHYNGSCLRPADEAVVPEPDYVPEEDYVFDYGEREMERRSDTATSSLMKLCYAPRRHESSCGSETVPEGEPDGVEKPLCIQGGINFRNSFWDLHRPELCKLTWPYEYVAEAVVTDHLHRHLMNHGDICAGFHDQRDRLDMLNSELDAYDKLKELESARTLPPDDPMGVRKEKAGRMHPCRPRMASAFGPVDLNDESDLDPKWTVRGSKEEFCITIGRPERKPPLREVDALDTEAGQLWLPSGESEYEGYEEYPFCPVTWTGSDYLACEGEAEGSVGEEASEPETVPPEPVGWVEPDFCAMI